MTYDPERGTLHPVRQTDSEFYSESGSFSSDSIDQSDAAVLDITPNTNRQVLTQILQ